MPPRRRGELRKRIATRFNRLPAPLIRLVLIPAQLEVERFIRIRVRRRGALHQHSSRSIAFVAERIDNPLGIHSPVDLLAEIVIDIRAMLVAVEDSSVIFHAVEGAVEDTAESIFVGTFGFCGIIDGAGVECRGALSRMILATGDAVVFVGVFFGVDYLICVDTTVVFCEESFSIAVARGL